MSSLRKLLAVSTVLAVFGLASPVFAVIVYDAGAALLANEVPDDAGDVVNPNPTAPNWSYGYRGTTLGPALTLFSAADHVDIGQFEGFQDIAPGGCCGSLPNVLVNTGPAVGAPDGSVGTGEITMHPDGSASGGFVAEQKAVVRFTASIAGSYNLSALFEDVDDCCGFTGNGANNGPGVDVHIVRIIAGVPTSIFDDVISRETVSGDVFPTATSFAGVVSLGVGDQLDFVVGTNSQLFGDNTRFNAVLTLDTALPEPASLSMIALGGLALGRRRRAA